MYFHLFDQISKITKRPEIYRDLLVERGIQKSVVLLSWHLALLFTVAKVGYIHCRHCGDLEFGSIGKLHWTCSGKMPDLIRPVRFVGST